MTTFSMISIMNAALTSTGMDEVTEDQAVPEYRVLLRNWPGIVQAELEDGLYNFTKTEANLQSRISGKFGFEDGYILPVGTLHVRRLWVLHDGQRCDVDWVQDAAAVYINGADGCFVEYVASSEEGLWSANFVRGVQCKLEAVLLRSMREEAQEAATMDAVAETHFERARTNSSKSRSAGQTYKAGGLARSRFHRG